MKRLTLLFCLLATIVSGQPIGRAYQQRQFSKRSATLTFLKGDSLYVDYDSAYTSAGISVGNRLAVTLWNNRKVTRGWLRFSSLLPSGIDDVGSALPDTTLTINLLVVPIPADKPLYTWEGGIGNTSDSITGSTVWHAAEGISDMAQAGNYVYVTRGYDEGKASHNKFDIRKPQQVIELTPGLSGGVGRFVETDSTLVYWAYGTNYGAPFYIAASRVSDDVFVALPNSTSLNTVSDPNDKDHVKYAGVWNMGSAEITGLAVQRSGNYVFVAQAATNQIQVRKKSDGTVLRNLSVTGAGLLALANSTLFVRPQSTTALTSINSYSVGSDGTLTPGYTLTGFSSVSWVSANSTGTELAVVDAGTQQRVRFFDVATGQEKTPLGQLGGYANTTKVADDRFMFEDVRRAPFGEYSFGALQPFVSYMSDGTIWVGDRGNLRVQHFAANHSTYLGQIAHLGYSYSTSADANDPTRIFSGYLEFKRDYSKPLGVNNGSWQLWRNWATKVQPRYFNQFGQIQFAKTLANGRTYFPAYDNQVFNRRIAELDTATGIRYTNITFNFTANLQADGSIITTGGNDLGTTFTATRYPLTGFSGVDPIYGTGVVVGTKANITGADPVTVSEYAKSIGRLDNGTFVSWSGDAIQPLTGTPVRAFGFRGGLLPMGATNWSALISPTTFRNYLGAMPSDGAFDVGNDVNYAGGSLLTRGNVFAWNFKGENWKKYQTNIFNFYHSSGLMFGQFGTTGTVAQALGGSTAAKMAGNVITAEMVKVGSDYYIYHCDEGYHAFIHSWKLSGFDNAQLLSLPLVKSAITKAPVLNYVDLMVGLPRGDTLRNGAVAGWSTLPTAFSIGEYNRFNPLTRRYTYRADENDVAINWFPPDKGTSANVTRTLPVNGPLSAWSVRDNIAYPIASEPGTNAFDVLDNTGKIIARFNKTEYVLSANGSVIPLRQTGPVAFRTTMQFLQPLVITRVGSQVSIRYADYAPVLAPVFESGADISRPATIRAYFANAASQNSSHGQVIANPKFYPQ